MRRRAIKYGSFLAFTALFAVLAGFVFWGAWSLDVVPVMPDCATTFPLDPLTHWLRGWAQSGKFVPGDVIAFLGTPSFWVELQYVLAVYCAALGMAYFLRGRGLHCLAAYGAGLFLAFCGYWLTLFSAGHLGWFQWMTYGVFAFGLIDRVLTKGKLRHWLLLGACLAWGSFYQPDLWLLFTVFTAVYFVYRWVQTVCASATSDACRSWLRFFPVRWLKGGALALAVFLLIGFPSFRSAICDDLTGRDQQIAAGETVGAAADDAEKRWIFVTNWSMPPEDTLEFFCGRIHGDTSCPMTLAIGAARGNGIRPYTGRLGRPKDAPAGNYRQHSLYVGWMTCLLALVGLLSACGKHHRADILFFAVAALVFWISSMGRFCEPVYRLVYNLPMGDYLRAPVKWHHLTEFCLVALAGFGLDTLLRKLRNVKLPSVVPLIVTGGLIVIGTVDLAVNAHRFCAPHHADTQIAPLTQYPVERNNEKKRGDLLAAARAQKLAPIGFAPFDWLTPDPRAKELDVLWLEQPVPRPPVREPGRLPGGAFALAVLSALVTVGMLGFAGAALVDRRVARWEVA